MKPFHPRGQAMQDRFAFEILGGKTDGTFLDCGACHPTEISNTYALEQLRWRGLLIDNDPGAIELCKAHRESPAILADATTLDWREALDRFGLPEIIDYLSLDVDAATLPALQNLMRANPAFRVITIEHDSYRFGPGPRDAMRQILRDAGYDLVCADVCSSDGVAYEDWWTATQLSRAADRFRCSNKKWTEIFPA